MIVPCCPLYSSASRRPFGPHRKTIGLKGTHSSTSMSVCMRHLHARASIYQISIPSTCILGRLPHRFYGYHAYKEGEEGAGVSPIARAGNPLENGKTGNSALPVYPKAPSPFSSIPPSLSSSSSSPAPTSPSFAAVSLTYAVSLLAYNANMRVGKRSGGTACICAFIRRMSKGPVTTRLFDFLRIFRVDAYIRLLLLVFFP